jgi:HTH-type transcriptional regulator/antitoxin HipB
MKINTPEELSGFLKQKRKKDLYSQTDVSAKTGVQQQTVSAFERNSNQAKIETLFRLVNALGLELHLEDKNAPAADQSDQWQEEW